MCRVGERAERVTLDYCAPEAFQGDPVSFSMDLFSLGRILYWLTSANREMWPNLSLGATDDDKRAFLASEDEFSVEGIAQPETRRVVQHLMRKTPAQRMTLDKLRTSVECVQSWV
jgi:serine/threonine protein kinase